MAFAASTGFVDIADLPYSQITKGWFRSSLAIRRGHPNPLYPDTAVLSREEQSLLRLWERDAVHNPDERDNIALICRKRR